METAMMAESFVSWFALGDNFVVAGCGVVHLSHLWNPPLPHPSAAADGKNHIITVCLLHHPAQRVFGQPWSFT